MLPLRLAVVPLSCSFFKRLSSPRSNLAPILHRFRDSLRKVQNRYIYLPLLGLTRWDDIRKVFTQRSCVDKVPNGVKTLPKISIV